MTTGYRARAAILAVALALLAGCGSDDSSGGSATGTTARSTATTTTAVGAVQLGPAFPAMDSLPGALKTPPPWLPNNGKTLQLRLRAIGLAPLTEEGQVVHIHQHLDLYVDGDKVTLPANVGSDVSGGFISDLHTHERDGILHVESPTQRLFGLGQFFAVWGVPLSSRRIGGACETNGTQLRVWVNGAPLSADPTRIVLEEHQEIVIALGTAAQMPDPVPASFDFAAAGL